MTWTIEFERAAAKEFSSLDPVAQRRIRSFLQQRVLTAEHPRILGKPLRGTLGSLWRYRVGPYWVVADVQDHRLVVLIVRLAQRSTVYRK